MLDPQFLKNLLQFLYVRKAKVLRWVDGDTVELFVDQGFDDWKKVTFRLLGIDTPERNEAGYTEATAFAQSLAPVGKEVVIQSFKPFKDDSFGRYLVKIYSGDTVFAAEWTEAEDVNQALIAAGHAEVYTR